tara:strand:- start:188 stop:385 length:198 start_codon:yes stop_codon:yes gene_type:complete
MINTPHLILKRIEKGLSQKELAELIGKDKDTIYRYENGKLTPSIQAFSDWIKALETEPNRAMKWQ